MLDKLYECLKLESQLIEELIKLSMVQQEALITFKIKNLMSIAETQDKINQKLREYEDFRIRLLMNWLNINRTDAINLKLSSIERKLPQNQMVELRRIRLRFKKMVTKLHSLNTTNRVLANRARNSVQNILMTFTNGGNRVFNVKV